MRGYSDLVLFRRLLRHIGPHWPHIIGVWALSLLSIPFALLTPLPLKIAVDSVIGSHPLPGFFDALLPATIVDSASAVLVLAVALILGEAP